MGNGRRVDNTAWKRRDDEGVIQSGITDYKTFLTENQKKINLMLNKFLRFSILIGPLLMLAIRFGIFHSVTYASCIVVSLLVLSLSCVHYVLIRREGKSSVVITCDPDNTPSRRTCEELGCALERTVRVPAWIRAHWSISEVKCRYIWHLGELSGEGGDRVGP